MALFGRKTRLKGRSNTADTRQPRVATDVQKWFQTDWRKSCLMQRAAEGRMTEKNFEEAKRLGMTVVDVPKVSAAKV